MSVLAPIISAIVNSVVSTMADDPSVVTAVPAYVALSRPFPVDAKKGQLTPPIQQYALIGGKSLNVAPGLQVRNEQNLIVMPNTLQQSVNIRYQLDQMGSVWRIWILTAAEQAAPETEK